MHAQFVRQAGGFLSLNAKIYRGGEERHLWAASGGTATQICRKFASVGARHAQATPQARLRRSSSLFIAECYNLPVGALATTEEYKRKCLIMYQTTSLAPPLSGIRPRPAMLALVALSLSYMPNAAPLQPSHTVAQLSHAQLPLARASAPIAKLTTRCARTPQSLACLDAACTHASCATTNRVAHCTSASWTRV